VQYAIICCVYPLREYYEMIVTTLRCFPLCLLVSAAVPRDVLLPAHYSVLCFKVMDQKSICDMLVLIFFFCSACKCQHLRSYDVLNFLQSIVNCVLY